jgi:hypothetical protein
LRQVRRRPPKHRVQARVPVADSPVAADRQAVAVAAAVAAAGRFSVLWVLSNLAPSVVIPA